MTIQQHTVTYDTIKKLIGVVPTFYVKQGDDGYEIFAASEIVFVNAKLFGSDSTSITDFESTYKYKCTEAASHGDAFVLGMLAAKVPFNTLRTTDGRLRSTSEKPNVSRATIYTHNWCDPTTWYTKSTLISTESVSFNVTGSKYVLANKNVIDTYHGKITGEDFLLDSNNRNYRVTITANGTFLTEQDPHYGSGGDFTVNYDNGEITALDTSPFYSSSLTGFASPVKVTYHFGGNSTFVLKPFSGKSLQLTLAECQFSADVMMNDSVSFQPYGKVEVFAPQYSPVPYPAGTLIPLGAPVRYKTMVDFFNESMRSYPNYPALSSGSWRGIDQPSVVLDWDYVSSQTLYSSQGMEVRIFLDHHNPFSGSFATTTFYCISENE